MGDLCYHVLRLLSEGADGPISEKLQHVGQMIKLTHQLREQNEKTVLNEAKEVESFGTITDSKERWSKAKSKDKSNEKSPRGRPVGRARSGTT